MTGCDENLETYETLRFATINQLLYVRGTE